MHLHDVPQRSLKCKQCPLPICHQELLETGQEKAGHSRCPAKTERWSNTGAESKLSEEGTNVLRQVSNWGYRARQS